MRRHYNEDFDYDHFDEFESYRFYSDKKNYEQTISTLQPLKIHLKKYDTLLNTILNENVSMMHLKQLTDLLNTPIKLQGQTKTFSLANPKEIDWILYDAGVGDVMLDIRRGDFNFPNYYLCEADRSYSKNYGIVIKEFYKSPNYQIPDPRFVQLMHNGHEMPFVRMSNFRDKVKKFYSDENKNDRHKKTDKLLEKIGESFLQTAWHEDQEVGWIVSELFQLSKFREVMELFYFNLGTDFSLLRNEITPDVTRFFEEIYPQPALLTMFKYIDELNAYALKEIEQETRFYYGRMNQLFSELLQIPLQWGEKKVLQNVPFYKILFANISRIEHLKELKKKPGITEICAKLEGFAEEVKIRILNPNQINAN